MKLAQNKDFVTRLLDTMTDKQKLWYFSNVPKSKHITKINSWIRDIREAHKDEVTSGLRIPFHTWSERAIIDYICYDYLLQDDEVDDEANYLYLIEFYE